MSYTISLHPTPPTAPNALLVLAGQHLRIPSAWRWLTRMWERNLLEIKGFNSLIPGLSSTGALEELAGWEKSYHILERYHNFMLSKIDKGYLSGKNLMAFEAVVEATKAEVASIITSLMLAGRQKGPYQRDSYLVDGLVTIGNRTLLELVVK